MNPRRPLEMLIVRCQIGDKSAFKELFEAYQWRLRYYVRHLDHTGEDVDDILQELSRILYIKTKIYIKA